MTSRTEWEDAVDDIARADGIELEDFDHYTDESGSRCYAICRAGRDLLTFWAFSDGAVVLDTEWLSPVSGDWHRGPVFKLDEPTGTSLGWHALLAKYHRLLGM